ncbi:MAG TPA: redoxin family protein [Phycisphaerales bacterium]|nr:redoxin family protein [Phycisphaerales bacterium]
MKLRGAACVAAALALVAGAPALAQDAKPKPERAPGVEAERIGELMVGDRAPELAIGTWVKGEPVTGFEEGKVYVVECWATWCGPCIAGMPHLSELQKEYKDKGVTIIGVNIWDDPANVEPFMEKRGGDEKMEYTVAVEEKIEGEEIEQGRIAKEWMAAAGRNGIPSAFIVDQKGYVAWIGHPGSMDHALEQVVAGKWDLAKAADAYVAEQKMEAKFEKLQELIGGGEYDQAAKLAEELVSGPAWESAMALNGIAWPFVDPDMDVENRHTDLAIKAAERAAELTDHEDPAILDTLAWAYYHAGQKEKAIETETKAVSLAPSSQKEMYEAALERMKE